MNVPPYVPQPIEIPGNVTEEGYVVKLGFIRRVAGLFGLSVALVAGAAFLPYDIGIYGVVWVVLALLALSATRGLAKGRPVEQKLSLALSPALFIGLGLLVKRVALDWPIWTVGVGCACVILYTFCCGRDLSFMGMWFLSILISSIINVVLMRIVQTSLSQMAEALVVDAAFLSYWVYDLAALLTRRRLGEEVGAVLDLYRDVLNMFSYPIRVWDHWRTHRIWSARS